MHDCTMTATIYMYSTDQLQGISLSCAERQSERVRHALTTRAVSRLIDSCIIATHGTKIKNALRNAQWCTLGGRYLDSSCVADRRRSGRSVESTSIIAQ